MNFLKYNNLTKDLLPHNSLLAALELVTNRDEALDIGSGGFRDTKALVGRFKHVIAVDMTKALSIPPKVTFYHLPIEEFNFDVYDLINAQFSLPFIHPRDFLEVWEKIKNALNPGGVFVGQFFGVDDDWKNCSLFTKDQVEALIKTFTVKKFKEVNKDGKTLSGEKKHWHYFEVILLKS